jgi:lipopolysaccharide export system permease protein
MMPVRAEARSMPPDHPAQRPETALRRLDSYILRLILRPFLFFVLVFTGVIWLGQSLKLIDIVVNNGQSARTFLEFTLLLLPTVESIVLPIAAFAATLFTMNRLAQESEIVAMFAAGSSGTSLLRPVAAFAVPVMIATFALTLFAMPASQRSLRDRISEIRGDVAAAFLREGSFQSPVRGITVYLRGMGAPGELLGIFVHDERDRESVTTYTAKRAVLLGEGADARLVMFDGIAQTALRHEANALTVLRFDQFTYDLSRLADTDGNRRRKPSELFLTELLAMNEAEAGQRPLGAYRAEAHEALSSPLYTLALPLLAVAFVITGGFRRHGFTGRILAATVACVGLRLVGLGLKAATSAAAGFWPTMYLPPVLGVALALWLVAGRPSPWPPSPARNAEKAVS